MRNGDFMDERYLNKLKAECKNGDLNGGFIVECRPNGDVARSSCKESHGCKFLMNIILVVGSCSLD